MLVKDIISGFLKKSPITVALPSEVILETTNKCNLRCIMCHIHSHHVTKKRPEGFIEGHLWRKIIDELGSWGQNVNLLAFGAGETLLHPDIIDIVSYASAKGNITVGFLTNGMLLRKELSGSLIDAGLKWLSVSLDGTSADVVETYRKGATLATIERNIRDFAALRRRPGDPFMRLNMTLVPGALEELDGFVKKWLPIVDEVTVSTFRPIGKRTFEHPITERTPCHYLNRMIVIAHNGDVGLCCEDNFIEHKLGNVEQSTVRDVWYGRDFMQTRQLHQDKRYNAIPLCRQCDSWSTGMLLKEYITPDGYPNSYNVKEYSNQKIYTNANSLNLRTS